MKLMIKNTGAPCQIELALNTQYQVGILFQSKKQLDNWFAWWIEQLQHEKMFVISGRDSAVKVRIVRQFYDVEMTDSLLENLQFVKMSQARTQQLQQLLPTLDFTKKMTELTAYDQVVARLVYGTWQAELVLINELFTNLTESKAAEIILVIKKLQHYFDICFLILITEAKDGRYIEKLFGTTVNLTSVLPLK